MIDKSMPELNSILISVVAAFLIHYLYIQYVESTKDVNELYLNEQSRIEAVREKSESAIYKSNKLEIAGGLRVGLDIRYDYYKSRSGNLSDVWEVLMSYARKHKERSITVNDRSMTVLKINHAVNELGKYLKESEILEIKVRLNMVSELTFDSLVILIAGFINQVSIELYEDIRDVQFTEKSLLVTTEKTSESIHYTLNLTDQTIYNFNESLEDFENVYTFTKDMGIALKVVRRIGNIVSKIEFTQLNIVSAIASTLKHLPMTQELNDQDRVVIVQSPLTTNVHLFNKLVKILSTFLSHSELIIIGNTCDLRQIIIRHNPTVLSVNSPDWARLTATPFRLGLFSRLIYKQSFMNLCRGKFPSYRFIKNNLRLIYINQALTLPEGTSPEKLNKWRCYLLLRIIVESGYYNIMGPVILTDFYDYRLIDTAANFGCLTQSVEIKLTDVKDNKGEVTVRGYSIGKTTNMIGDLEVEQNKSIMKKSDGFMPLANVTGRFGNDGCMYVTG